MRKALAAIDRAYWKSGVADDVPAMAYYLIISLAPLIAGVTAIGLRVAAAAFDPAAVDRYAQRALPPEAQHIPSEILQSAPQTSDVLLVFAVLTMLWTTSGAIGVMERCATRISGSRRHPIVLGRIRNVALGGLFGILLVASIVAASLTHLVPVIGDQPAFVVALPLLIASLALTLLLRLLCRDALTWTGCVAALAPAIAAMFLAPRLVGFAVSHALASASTGGVLATIASLAAACYLLAQGILLGVALAAHMSPREGDARRSAGYRQ